MSTPSPANKIQVASVSDRGLSEKRPMNEDSFVADAEHRIFAVADGVALLWTGRGAFTSSRAISTIDARSPLGTRCRSRACASRSLSRSRPGD